MSTGVDEPAPAFELPAYSGGALNDVLPAIGYALGVEDCADPWGLNPTDRACLFLIDGMGSELIRANADAAPYLAALLNGESDHGGPAGIGRTITAGFPSTTSTSLSSIGTGVPPGAHGMLGYRLAVPGTGKLMNFLKWDQDVDPLAWQPRETMFERMSRAGVTVTHVSSPRFAESGLTRSVFRGARFNAAEAPELRAAGALDALEAADRTFVYAYYSDLDFVGHASGVGSPAWGEHLHYVDALVRWIAERLPAGCSLFVVADHGMLDVPRERRIDMDTDWELRAGVALLGGEARARHVYAQPGAARDVLAIWTERLDGVAEVRSRDAAIREGWFGPGGVEPTFAERIGDVVVALRGDWAVTATEREPVESRLIGMHGSMTPVEQLVPLIEVRG